RRVCTIRAGTWGRSRKSGWVLRTWRARASPGAGASAATYWARTISTMSVIPGAAMPNIAATSTIFRRRRTGPRLTMIRRTRSICGVRRCPRISSAITRARTPDPPFWYRLSSERITMTTILFLHGGGMGGWVWEEVADTLRREGHKVLTPTFTGFGERSHLIGRDVTHDVHVQDIVNVLKFEDARDVVLVAFSYGGSVAPGVVAKARDRIRRVVYLDGIVPDAGKSVMEAMGYMTGE